MGVNETITVINRSGKVVSSSKHIVDVFREAQSAYREKKAELKAERDAAALQEKKLRKGMKALRVDDDTHSRASSHRSSKSHRSKAHRSERPPFERGYTDSFYANDERRRHKHHRAERDLAGDAQDGHQKELLRRNTGVPVQSSPLKNSRSNSEPYIDMDLAYGRIPPPLPDKQYEEDELRYKASKLEMLLEEANCLQHSVTAIIDNLEKKPEDLAAVALTLAEISNIVGKMGPGILAVLRQSFPAVAALLVSPQFTIAVGVGLGVTIVALGGYKIMKKIQEQQEEERVLEGPYQRVMEEPYPRVTEEPYQLDELQNEELSRIEIWRRGIAEVEAESAGTIVDGEFVTPSASQQLIDAGVLDREDLKSRRSSHKSKHHHSHATNSTKSSRRDSKSADDGGRKKKKKEPSGLRNLFIN